MSLRHGIACLLAGSLVLTACGAKGADEAAKRDQATATTAAESSSDGSAATASTTKFGTLESPCGKSDKVPTIKSGEAGLGSDKLYIGVGNDRTGVRPGLLKELWDSTTAFVQWCNAQGGIDGLPLEAVDLNAEVVNVEASMAKACTDVFAMVGGGWTQDNFAFSGKDGSDFHKCKMIAFPGITPSPDMAEASDVVNAMPTPIYEKPTDAYNALATMYPKDVANFGVVYGTLPSIKAIADQTIAVAKQVKGFGGFGTVSYDLFNQDWAVVAQQVLDQKMRTVLFLGEPANFAKFSQALHDQGFDGEIVSETNQYDRRLIELGGDSVNGVIVKTPTYPFEEAAKWPTTKQLVTAMDKYTPDWVHAGLVVQSFSASLLFATAAKKCADQGEISRECVLKEGKAVTKWTAGGLHAPTDPSKNQASNCVILMQVKDGEFTRLFPKIGSKDDNGDGFACSEPAKISGDFGKGNTSSSILG